MLLGIELHKVRTVNHSFVSRQLVMMENKSCYLLVSLEDEVSLKFCQNANNRRSWSEIWENASLGRRFT